MGGRDWGPLEGSKLVFNVVGWIYFIRVNPVGGTIGCTIAEKTGFAKSLQGCQALNWEEPPSRVTNVLLHKSRVFLNNRVTGEPGGRIDPSCVPSPRRSFLTSLCRPTCTSWASRGGWAV